jgi:integrase
MAGGQQAEGPSGRDARSNGADVPRGVAGVDGGSPERADTDPLRPSLQASRGIRAYDDALRLRVLPTIGSKRLGDVTRNDVQDLADKLLAEGDAPSAISVALLPIRAVYRRAISRGEVAINPTTGLELPASRAGRDRIASPDECRRLLAALPAGDRPLWATAMFGGLRRGELQALRIKDIDLARGIIRVHRGWDHVEGEITTKSGTHICLG